MRIRIEGEEAELAAKALEAARQILRALESYEPQLSKAVQLLDSLSKAEEAPAPKRRFRFHVRDERALSKGVAEWTTASQYGQRAVDTGSSGPNYKYKVPIPKAAAVEDIGQMRTSMESLVEDLHESPRPARNREDYYFRDGKAFPVYGARDYHLAAHAFWDEELDPHLIELANERAQQREANSEIDPWVVAEREP
jgi:hypothetical protein